MNVSDATFDKLLGKFFKDVRKQNGGKYEPDSISSFRKSTQRHLKELKLPFNILQDEEFDRSREVLAARRKSLVKQGRGKKKKRNKKKGNKNLRAANLVATTPKYFSVHCGGYFPLTLVSGLRMRAGFWGDLEL